MKLILDEDLPHDLLKAFKGTDHEVVHVEDLGWKGIRNGDLLRRISGTYDALITGDTNMRYQQNLARYDVAIVVLQPRVKVLEQLLALIPATLAAIPKVPKGEATIIAVDDGAPGA
jgi:predicted nuclease of predicted toxin-antitoxin system